MAAFVSLVLVVAACADEEAPAPTATLPSGALNEIAPEMDTVELAPVDDDVTPLAFDDFYTQDSSLEGLQLSDKLQALDGRKVVMRGYMAPPLKPMLDFFVLTEVRLAYCPFCSSAAEWPDDIAVVYTPSPMRATERAIMVEGTIETGSKVDAQTGMLSLVRIYADRIGKL